MFLVLGLSFLSLFFSSVSSAEDTFAQRIFFEAERLGYSHIVESALKPFESPAEISKKVAEQILPEIIKDNASKETVYVYGVGGYDALEVTMKRITHDQIELTVGIYGKNSQKGLEGFIKTLNGLAQTYGERITLAKQRGMINNHKSFGQEIGYMSAVVNLQIQELNSKTNDFGLIPYKQAKLVSAQIGDFVGHTVSGMRANKLSPSVFVTNLAIKRVINKIKK